MNIPELGIYDYCDTRHRKNADTIQHLSSYFLSNVNRNLIPDDIFEFYKYYREQINNGNFVELNENSYGYAYCFIWETYYRYLYNNVSLNSNTYKEFKYSPSKYLEEYDIGYIYDKNTCRFNNISVKMFTIDELKNLLEVISKYDIPIIKDFITRVNFNEPEIIIDNRKYCNFYNNSSRIIYVDECIKNEITTREILRTIILDRFFTHSNDIITTIDSNYKLNFIKNNKVATTPLNRILKNVIHKSYVNLGIQHLSLNSPLINIGRCDTTIKYHKPKNEPTEDYYNRLLEYKTLRKKYDDIELKCPEIVEGDFIAKDLNLNSLKGCPKIVNGNFIVNNNNLSSFEGLPEHIGGYLDISNNEFTDAAWESAKENITIDFNGYRMHHNMFNKYRKELY